MFKRPPKGLKKGYLQVVGYPQLSGVGDKYEVFYEQRPLFHQLGHAMIYFFSKEQKLKFFGVPNKDKIGLFSTRGELVVVAWELPAVATTFAFDIQDPRTKMWTTKTPDRYTYQEEIDQDFNEVVKDLEIK